MRVANFVAFLCSLAVGDALYDPITRIVRPHVETYWESWELPGNFVSELSDVPVTPTGSTTGVNIVNLAFANNDYQDDYECLASPDCITSGLEIYDSAKLHEAVKVIHAAGGLVKIAFGGDTYGNPDAPEDKIDLFVNRIVHLVDEYDLDGVDLTTVIAGMNEVTSYAYRQIEIIKRLRVLMPRKIISYTFPYLSSSQPTYSKVVENTMDDVDYFMMSQSGQFAIDNMIAFNVPKHKIVWGVIINEDCEMEEVVEAAQVVAAGQLGGVMTWSINADTYQRNNEEGGVCTEYQTGRSNAAFVNTISYILNE